MPDPLRVLVVDDSEVIRDLIAVNLELEGFEVMCAESGQAALEMVKQVKPHVVTLDVMMPGLDGFETAQRLREDPETEHIPIVMVTGRSQAADVVRGEAAGVEAYLSKPFEPAELVTVVRSLARSGRPEGTAEPAT